MIVLRLSATQIRALAFTNDGSLFILTERGRNLFQWRHGSGTAEPFPSNARAYGAILAMAATPVRPWLVVWHAHNQLGVWELETPRIFFRDRTPINRGGSVAFTPDARSLLCIPNERGVLLRPSLRRWTMPGGAPGMSIPMREAVRAMAISPSGRWLVTGSVDRQVRLWDLSAEPKSGMGSWMARLLEQMGLARPSEQSGELEYRTGIRDIAFSPDGRWLVTATGWTATLWPFDESDPSAAGKAIDLRGHRRLVDSVAFSPDGRLLATGSRDGTVKLWDMPNAVERATFDWDIGKVYHVAFSPDGMTLAAGGDDGRVVIWDVE